MIGVIGAINPFRRACCLAGATALDLRKAIPTAVVGYVLIALAAPFVRDLFDISAPNTRIAAGFVLIAVGGHALFAPTPRLDVAPGIRTVRYWLAPILFPVLLRPDIALVALAADTWTDIVTLAGAALAGFVLMVMWWVRYEGEAAPTRLAGALAGMAAVGAGVGMLFDGVFAV